MNQHRRHSKIRSCIYLQHQGADNIWNTVAAPVFRSMSTTVYNRIWPSLPSVLFGDIQSAVMEHYYERLSQ